MSAVLTSYAVFCNGCMSRGKMFILSSGHNTRTVLGTVVAGRRGSCLVWTMMTSNWEANYLSDAVGPPRCGETSARGSFDQQQTDEDHGQTGKWHRDPPL